MLSGMDRRRYLKASMAGCASLLLPVGAMSLGGCRRSPREPETTSFDGTIMGTAYGVRIGGTVAPGLAARVQAALADVDARMSTWHDASELVHFNAHRGTDWRPLSAPTLDVVAHAARTSEMSGGAFDATVGPLVDLWGFGAGAANVGSNLRRPRASAIRETLGRVDHAAIEIDIAAARIRKRRADVRLDLSGIAKGYGVDRVAALLDGEGYDSYLVEVGGELAARGRKPDGTAWRVAIERPDATRREAFRVVDLEDRAIATSGDYRHFFERGGERYSHAIDPRTGRPVRHGLASVSVITGTAMAADALSTALMILGPQAALAVAERHGIAAHLIAGTRRQPVEFSSPAFDAIAA